MNQQTCNRDWLDAFLKNDLNQREEQMLTSHLDDCADCREELESRAAEQSVWREASNLLGGSTKLATAAIGDSRSGTVHSPQIALVLQQLAPTDDPESLGRIGGYEVTGVVGAGGMGVVLKAHDRSLDRIVAIKVMAPHLASSGSARKRFAREAKAAAAVLHPNVIAIHSVASEDANPYLVMPFVRGASLQKRIDSQGPLPLKDTLRIGAQIAAGLAAAHEQGLVHRDIKPANILLEEGVERVTITDFGLARAVDDASMTCSGVIAGTPQYMSPEQARGEPIDARSDQFSLGGVLYAMCTGRSPFRAETTYGVLHRIANDKPTPVCEVNTDVPVWLGHFIERLMAKRPEDRFESAAQVADLLEGCLAHVQQPAAMPLPEAVASLAPKKTRRPPIGKFIAAATGACALLFAGVLIVLELGKGTLTIESELENVPIRIMQGDTVVEKLTVTKSGNSVRVAAGTYVVELDTKLDGMVVENDQVSLKRGTTEQVKIRYAKPVVNASDGSSTFRFETPDALMKHAADCQTKGDGPGFMDCWTDHAFEDFVPSYLLTSIMQLQYSENAPHSKPRHPEELVELQQILAEEFGSTEAGKSLLTLALAHKEIADRSVDKFAEAAEATAESPLVQLLTSGSAELINARSFIMKLSALHKKYEEPKAKKELRVFEYTVEQDGDKAVATETTGKNEFGLIKTEMGWRINDVFYGLKAKAESVTLQGEWEFISVESDGVKREYKTVKTQPSMARLTITGDMWTVKAGDGANGMGSGSHRVEVDGNKLTFHGMTTMMPGLGSNEEIPTIGYGIFEVDGDALMYIMTPAVAESALNGQGQPPVQFPDSFETKGTENNAFRLRRIHTSTPPTSTSSTNSSSSKSPPEYPPVKIVVHDEEGKPLEGVKVSLRQLAKEPGGQVLEINETSETSGLSVNRNLPYGHYELSAKTADGWYLTGLRSRLNVEFERGVDAILVAPTPGKTSKLVISSDLATSPEKISGLRFGGLTEDRWTQYAPEPEGSDSFKEQEFSSFPTITNGIEYVGAEIGLHITRNISQPAPSMQQMNTSWYWSRPPNSKVSIRYLIANGQARSFNEGNTPQNESLKRLPVEGSEFFKLPSPKYCVGAEMLKLGEPTQLPLELDIPAGDVRVKIGRFLGKPSAAVMAALNWQPQEQQPELWLQAYIAPDSAWVERLINMDWINSPFRSGSSVGFTALWRDQALQPGERLEIPLGMKQDQKTSLKTKAAKIIVDVYGGNRVLGQNNAKYVKLVQALDAIDDVQVNFREAGPGSDIALAIVRDPNGLMNQEANSTGKPSVRRDAITKALAQVPNVRWEEGVLGASLESNQTPAEQLFQDAMEEATADEAYQAMEKLLANAKMDWKSTESYIATAATRMTSNIEFAKHVLDHFKRACAGGESTYQARRNLLAVLSRAFQTWGQSRWSTAPASIQQHSKPSETRPQEILDFELSALEAIVSYGHKATRSDIVDFVRAARALHHPDAKPFLQDVVLNPQNPSADHYTSPVTNRTNTNLHVWRDNLGGTWPDARFVAAVGLAELGDQTAIEWLLDKAKPNDFGLDESINLSHHERDGSGSLRESCRCALIDLFGQPKDSTVAQLSDWWTSNRSQVTPRVVRLKSDFATKTVTPLERILANARSVVEAYVASAISGDVAQASALAKNSPADPKRIRELPEFLNVQRLKIETVYINDPTKPTQALATSVAIKLEEKHKNPDGRRDGFLVFTLELTDEKWFVIDIDFQTESGAEKELNKFLKANPNSIGIPPQS